MTEFIRYSSFYFYLCKLNKFVNLTSKAPAHVLERRM